MYLEKYKKLLEEGGNVQVDTVVLPDGEEHKTFDCMAMILDKALELGLDRKSTFVALGGGKLLLVNYVTVYISCAKKTLLLFFS